jgi:uncharacterized integral membrane protein (TIGR00698 family)
MAETRSALRDYGPGLLLTTAAVVVSIGISSLAGPALGALTVAVLLGALLANTVDLPASLSPGLRFASRNLLRAGVVLLGLSVTLDQVRQLGWDGIAILTLVVAATFALTAWLGGRMGVNRPTSVLIATGTAVCGASAIAAMSAVLPDKDEDIDDGAAVAIASVTLYGTVALIAFPLLAAGLSLDPLAQGAWAGASVHEVGQVVAAAAPAPSPGPEAAIIVKLTRVLLLAPLVALMAWQFRRSAPSGTGATGKAPSPVPPFLLGFVALVLLGSWVELPDAFLDAAGLVKDALLAAAMFGLGTGVVVAKLVKQGGSAMLLGAASSVFIAIAGLAGVLIVVG